MVPAPTGDAFLAEGFRSARFGPGQALDVSKYYLLLPNSIGLGVFSKPSDGLHSRARIYRTRQRCGTERRVCTDPGKQPNNRPRDPW